MAPRIGWTALLIAVLFTTACGGQQEADPPPSPDEGYPTLLITNQTAVHVSIYVLPSGIKTGIATVGTNCIVLDEVRRSTRRLRFEITSESASLTTESEAIFGQNWRIELGPWPRRWRWDMATFRPAERC